VPPRNEIDESVLWNTPPFVGSPIYKDKQIIGANIVMPVPIDLWISRPRMIKELRKKQLFPALRLAKECGLNMVALGASTPYACNYGKLPRSTDDPNITTGHAATAAMLKKWAISASEQTNLEFSNIKLAVFGAAGRLGKAVSRYLGYDETPRELLLIDLPDKVNLLKDLAKEIQSQNKSIKVSILGLDNSKSIPAFDGAVLVSNNTVPFLSADDLRSAKFWVDDSHPRAASIAAEEATRNDTLYIECYATAPEGVNTDFPFNLPSTNDCYTCFAEGYLAWQEKVDSDYVTGIPEVPKIAKVASLLEKYRFDVGPFFGKSGAVIG
jgi:predicted amino acid dehydrogenase